MSILSPAILDWYRKQQEGTAPIGPPPPPEAPPQPPPDAPTLPQATQPDALRSFLQQYGPDALAALQRSQEATQRRADIGDTLAGNFDRAESLIAGVQQHHAQPTRVPDQVKDWLARKAAAQEGIGIQGQIGAMDPNSRASMLAQLAAARGGQPLPAGTSAAEAPGFVSGITAAAAPTKTLAETGKVGAETSKVGEETAGLRAENAPSSPGMVKVGQQIGVVVAGLSNKQAREAIETKAKEQGIAIDWAKVGLEGQKLAQAKGQLPKALRDEFQGRQVVKDTHQLAEAMAKIRKTADTGTDDLALIYSFVKILDPGSAVREGEIKLAGTPTPLLIELQQKYKRAAEGQLLHPTLRAQYKASAEKLFAGQMERYSAEAERYKQLATKQGMDPSDVVLDTGLGAGGGAAGSDTRKADPLGIR